MGEVVRWEQRESVAILTVENPPVNALVQPVRRALFELVERAEADQSVGAILIQAEGRTFPAGADVREFTLETAQPTLAELCDRVEASRKPVIAAIQGTALGGGFELALACHYRIALRGAQFGFPEVTLGLVPTAGGTQRLPRITGARAALDILLTGRPVSAETGEKIGLVDRVIERNLDRAGFGSARNMAQNQTETRPSQKREEGLSDPARFLESVAARRKQMQGDARDVVSRVIDLVEAALLLPFEAGRGMERVAYEDLIGSDQAQGLRHAFLAERRAGRHPSFASVRTYPIETLGVICAAPLGRDIALGALAAGMNVVLADENQTAIARARRRMETSLDKAVEAGRLGANERDEQLRRLSISGELDALTEANFIIEALPEDLPRKQMTLAKLDKILDQDVIVASCSADVDLAALSQSSGRPEQMLAMHFIAPADRMRMVEIAPLKATRPEVTSTAIALARRLRKTPILSGAYEGLIVNTLTEAYHTAADFLLEDGASPAQVDAAMRNFGMPIGPFQARDLIGLDLAWLQRKARSESRDPAHRYSTVADRLCEAGWFGRKAGQGYYRYAEGEKGGRAAPETLALLRDIRSEAGITARDFSEAEIQTRCLLAMANAGAYLVEVGEAQRPSDVDAAALLGMGFARYRGGPMMAADMRGLLNTRNALITYADESAPEFWTPAPLFMELIKNGKTFDDLNED
ncbi:MAG: enoyl-CoA hydratase-related protein [Maritimibacter sp.]